MSVAVTSGSSRAGGERLFFARHAGPEKSRLFLPVRVSVSRGLDISRGMRLPRWMMMGNQFLRVSEVAAIMTAVIHSMSSDMRRGK